MELVAVCECGTEEFVFDLQGQIVLHGVLASRHFNTSKFQVNSLDHLGPGAVSTHRRSYMCFDGSVLLWQSKVPYLGACSAVCRSATFRGCWAISLCTERGARRFWCSTSSTGPTPRVVWREQKAFDVPKLGAPVKCKPSRATKDFTKRTILYLGDGFGCLYFQPLLGDDWKWVENTN